MAMPEEVRQAIQNLAEIIVAGDWAKLEADGRIGRLTASEGRSAVAQYGRSLTDLPDEAYRLAAIYELDDGSGWAIELPLWTKEEGRSDLTLSLTATRVGTGYRLVIDDLHVLSGHPASASLALFRSRPEIAPEADRRFTFDPRLAGSGAGSRLNMNSQCAPD